MTEVSHGLLVLEWSFHIKAEIPRSHIQGRMARVFRAPLPKPVNPWYQALVFK